MTLKRWLRAAILEAARPKPVPVYVRQCHGSELRHPHKDKPIRVF